MKTEMEKDILARAITYCVEHKNMVYNDCLKHQKHVCEIWWRQYFYPEAENGKEREEIQSSNLSRID